MRQLETAKRFLRSKQPYDSFVSVPATSFALIEVSQFLEAPNSLRSDVHAFVSKSESVLADNEKIKCNGVRRATNNIMRGLVSSIHFDFVAAAKMAKAAEFECSSLDLDLGTRINADLLWSIINLANGNAGQALIHAKSAEREADDEITRYVTTVLCRCAHWLLGDIDAFNAKGRSPTLGDDGRMKLMMLIDRSVEATSEWQQLRLPVAIRLCREVIEACSGSKRLASVALFPIVLMAQFSYEQGAFSEADSSIRAILPRVRLSGSIDVAVRAYTTIARAALRTGRHEFASLMLREGETLAQERGWPRLLMACLEERFEMLLGLDRVEEAQLALGQMQKLSHEGNCRSDRSHMFPIHVELARIRGSRDKSLCHAEASILRRLFAHALAHSHMHLAINVGVRFAVKLMELDNLVDASDAMARFITIACDGGLFQSILDGGPETGHLLVLVKPALKLSHHIAYVESLLEHWNANSGPRKAVKGGSRIDGQLTAREKKVLELIGLGYSNKKIAQRLGIAPETVKSHAKNIFVSLGSATRAEAVSRAMSIGLL
jgi:LuxR family transcriptional regulator, maltose regulon positive regulatory protein